MARLDGGLYLESYQPMPCYEPDPLLERVPPPGDCEPCRKFLTDLCVPAHRLARMGVR